MDLIYLTLHVTNQRDDIIAWGGDQEMHDLRERPLRLSFQSWTQPVPLCIVEDLHPMNLMSLCV